MSNRIKVGIGELNVVKAPDELITFALGSCVGICLYDATTKISGLSHIMLPDSNESSTRVTVKPYHFADIAIPALVKKMVQLGANRTRMKAKIAGGAKMFAATGNNTISSIGMRNIIVVKATLAKLKIQIIADDTGKNFARTVLFRAEDGIMIVKSAAQGEWFL